MSSSLPVMEHFYSLQGEGANAGKAAYFIRLGGCDVGCHWCDVKESWDFEGHEKLNVDDLVNEVYLTGTPNVVVTGGEPTLHNLDYLSQAIKSKNNRHECEGVFFSRMKISDKKKACQLQSERLFEIF